MGALFVWTWLNLLHRWKVDGVMCEMVKNLQKGDKFQFKIAILARLFHVRAGNPVGV